MGRRFACMEGAAEGDPRVGTGFRAGAVQPVWYARRWRSGGDVAGLPRGQQGGPAGRRTYPTKGAGASVRVPKCASRGMWAPCGGQVSGDAAGLSGADTGVCAGSVRG